VLNVAEVIKRKAPGIYEQVKNISQVLEVLIKTRGCPFTAQSLYMGGGKDENGPDGWK
jgi:hypothetical protein